MDIVIPLAKDRYTNYYELRMTLRSIEKNLTGYRDIYIIGEKPGWLNNVIHIPLNDISGRKAWSIFRKMLTAANSESVSQKFISWADDTYLLEPLQTCDFKAWYDNTLQYWLTLNVNSLYRNIIRNTHKEFPEGIFYNVHTPCIYDKDKFKSLTKYNWSTTEYLIKSMYFNLYPYNPEPMKDPKRHKGLFYSSSGKMYVNEDKMLRELFPNPSRYEANNNTHTKAAFSLAKAAR